MMSSNPGGTTRPAMREAMKMFQPPRVKKDGSAVEPRPPRLPTEIPDQRDIFDHFFDNDLPMWEES